MDAASSVEDGSDSSAEEAVFVSIKNTLRGTSAGQFSLTAIGFESSKASSKRARSENLDVLVEQTLMGRRRKRPGVRGRPKLEDLGFGRSKTHKLSPQTSQLMGKANLAFVNKSYDEAVKALLEVVRLSPNCHEPYHTLGLLFEELDQPDKSLGFYMLAAHLSLSDVELWTKSYELSLRLGKDQEAVYCVSKVIGLSKAGEVSFSLFQEKCNLLLRTGRKESAVKAFLPFLQQHVPISIDAFKEVASLALRHEVLHVGSLVFEQSIGHLRKLQCPWKELWSPVNLLLELLLLQRNYARIVELMDDMAIERSGQQDSHQSLPVEIYGKLLIAKIFLNKFDPASELQNVMSIDPRIYHDVVGQIADALFFGGDFESSLGLFLLILPHIQDLKASSDILNKLGMCYRKMQLWEHAREAFEASLLRDPSREDTRSSLVETLHNIGRHAEAREALQEGHSIRRLFSRPHRHDQAPTPHGGEDPQGTEPMHSPSRPQSPGTKRARPRGQRIGYSADTCTYNQELFRRFCLIYDEIVADCEGGSGEPHFKELHQESLKKLLKDAMFASSKLWDFAKSDPCLLLHSKARASSSAPNIGGLSAPDWIKFLVRQCYMLYAMGRFDTVLAVAKDITESRLARADTSTNNVRRLHFLTLYKRGDFHEIVNALRFVWLERRQDLVPLFYRLTSPNPVVGVKAWSDVNFFRAIHRAYAKHPRFTSLVCLLGHLSMLSGNHKDAINYYRSALGAAGDEHSDSQSVVALFLANSLLQRCLQRTCPDPKKTLVEGMSHMLRYHRHFTQPQFAPKLQAQAHYNLGKAFHGLSLHGAACLYYRRSLRVDPRYFPAINNLKLILELHA